MKIVHLNTQSAGGSYEYAAALSRGLTDLGHASHVICRSPQGRPFSDRLLRRTTVFFSRGAWHGTRRCWSPPEPAVFKDADVVHLHTVADWFNVPQWLDRLPSKIRVVVGLHDLWHFSGGCFIYGSCEGFRSGCGNCPILHFPANRVLAADEVRRKTAAYSRRGVRFVANSQWLKRLAEASRVVNIMEVAVIPPPIDITIFHPQERSVCRAELELANDDLVVATGCASLTDDNKNTRGLLEVLASLDEPRLRVIVFGEGEIPAPSNLQVRFLGPLQSKERLARVYGAADLFASMSRMETYGLTLAEALACGTPVIANAVGGIPEAVPPAPGVSHLCDPRDQGVFRKSLLELLKPRPGGAEILKAAAEQVRKRNCVESAAKAAVAVYCQ